MGKILDKKFERRFGGNIVVVYPAKPNSPAKQRDINLTIANAFEKISEGIMRRKHKDK
ncbi:MAG: hypothetical protein PHP45_08465 [Elusimicrobiales bacterium]|nr:hypothetical protein [Elusimicrobiales bacterium]